MIDYVYYMQRKEKSALKNQSHDIAQTLKTPEEHYIALVNYYITAKFLDLCEGLNRLRDLFKKKRNRHSESIV